MPGAPRRFLDPGRLASMGTGGTCFRWLVNWAGALCVVLAHGCRTSGEADELRSLLHIDADGAAHGSLAQGHRFGRWLEVDSDPAARTALEDACLLEQTGASEQAIAVLTEALEDGTPRAALLEARGALYLATGFPRAAAGDFQRAAGMTPECARTWFALGHAYETLMLTRQSLEALERAVRLGWDDTRLHLSLARVHRSLGRLGQAARHYERVLEDGETSLEILAEAAVLASDDTARKAGVAALSDRIEACRGVQLSDDAWLLRALLRELPDESEESVAATFRALEIAPADLLELTRSLLTAVQLVDTETGTDARARLFAAERDEQRRAALERCVARQ